ncbi:hypothetical protein [Nocardioides rubriscoriae]|uniref:hypothetical protein n=1 Tax=Nocardioides rubriscoriae TaxID=642762 RepID=UPI0011DF900D|nr:hypothetical protein [Nocardioides rubriscoriae]
MKPLQSIAMGMVVILLVVPVGGYDVLADPLGWVLVVLGVRRLPEDVELRSTLLGVAVLAGLVSVPLWVPAVVDALDDADESIAWAVNLPQFGFYVLLSHTLFRAATAAGDKGAATWWSSLVLAFGAVVALPVLIFGGGLTGLEGLAGVLVGLTPTVAIVLAFVHSGRAWAGGEADARRPPTGRTRGRPSEPD